MNAVIEQSGQFPVPLTTPPRLTATHLAACVDEQVAAQWRGDDSAAGHFFDWLAGWWRSGPSPEPATAPRATSVLGAGGCGIRWYEVDSVILGFVSERPDGCYAVPRTAPPRRPRPIARPDHHSPTADQSRSSRRARLAPPGRLPRVHARSDRLRELPPSIRNTDTP